MELQQRISEIKVKRSPKMILLSTLAPFLKENQIFFGLAKIRIDAMSEKEVEIAKQTIIKCAKELQE